MNHAFSLIPKANIPRSMFNRTSRHLTTFNAGYLIPVYVDEVIPGDTFNMNMTFFARLTTPIVPLMDNIYMDSFFFYVPLRLIWDNFKKFMGERTNPDDSIDYLCPTVKTSGYTYFLANEGSLFDYFGLPTKVQILEDDRPIAFFSRAYNLIWNEWFRDQNLQNSVQVKKDDTGDVTDNYVLLKRGKRHDYFTSCLPWPQKGDDVLIPVSGEAPVLGIGKAESNYSAGPYTVYESNAAQGSYANYDTTAAHALVIEEDPNNPNYPYVRASFDDASLTATINNLRLAFQVQKLLEKDARGGTRYIEMVRSHFGVTSPDARVQRPEYLGGGSTRINIHPVAQTSETNTTPQGNLAAFGTASGRGHGFTKSFTEHGVIIGLVSARADLTYQQGMNRMWSRQTRLDFYWPELSHIGEQEVLNKEIYAQGTTEDNEVFGYQERYAEYRYKPSIISGKFRSNATSTIDLWHLSQEFGSLPALGNTFIQENPPLDRVQAVTGEPHFFFDASFDLRCARPMPMYGVPGLIDHF